jgi:hypothetical protein
MTQLNSKTKTSKNSKSPKKPPTLPTNLIEEPSKKRTPTKRTKGGVNLAPLISAVLLAAVRLGLEKKRERLASSKTR